MVDHIAFSSGCTCPRTRVNTFLIHTGKFPLTVSVKYTFRATSQLRTAKVSWETLTPMLVPLFVAKGICTTGVWNTGVTGWGWGLRDHYLWSGGYGRPFSMWDNGHIIALWWCLSNGWEGCCWLCCFSYRRWKSGRLSNTGDGGKCAANKGVTSETWQTAADGIVVDDATLCLNSTCTTAWINTAFLEASQERRTLTGHYALRATCWGVTNEASLT